MSGALTPTTRVDVLYTCSSPLVRTLTPHYMAVPGQYRLGEHVGLSSDVQLGTPLVHPWKRTELLVR